MVYAEKVIIVKDGQRCPMHYHFVKTEDIINRGGGVLALELVETGPDGKADPSREVIVRTDAMERRLPAHGILRLHPRRERDADARPRPCLLGRGRRCVRRRGLDRQRRQDRQLPFSNRWAASPPSRKMCRPIG
jgi:hypothetical protein